MSMDLKPLGLWVPLDGHIVQPDGASTGPTTARDTAAFVRRAEALGYGAVWIPEGMSRNPLVHAAWLLANTETITIATGIASIYARDAMAMAAAQRGLNEQSGGRFLLGLGVSHAVFVEGVRGHDYGKPVATMRNYLAAMAAAPYGSPLPVEKPVTVLAALRDKMLALAAEQADGAHPLNVTPDHTARARKILGPDKRLCVEQKLILETDPAKARAIGREALKIYLGLENYRNAWAEMGFSAEDMAGGGSDRLVDGLIGWGDETALRRRLREHFDAGASHVCFNPVCEGGGIDMRVVELLAPGKS
jgi:probable F420-dependent oxidoreductase